MACITNCLFSQDLISQILIFDIVDHCMGMAFLSCLLEGNIPKLIVLHSFLSYSTSISEYWIVFNLAAEKKKQWTHLLWS